MITEIVLIVALFLDVWVERRNSNEKTAWSLFILILDRSIVTVNFWTLYCYPDMSLLSKLFVIVAAIAPPIIIITVLKEFGIVFDLLSKASKLAIGHSFLFLLLLDVIRNYMYGAFSDLSWSAILIRIMLRHISKSFFEQKPHLDNPEQQQQQQSTAFVAEVDRGVETKKPFTCLICFEELDWYLFNRLPCSHGMCYNCRVRMHEKVRHQPEPEQWIACPACQNRWPYNVAFAANKL